MNKKFIILGMTAILALALVSAGLVSHFATVKADINVESPLILDQSLFTFDSDEVLNDGQNHYILIKGENTLDVEVPADVIITVTRNGFPVDGVGLYLAVDAGGDMHYSYDEAYNPNKDDWKTWMLNNADWFDWIGTSTYELSGFENPVTNHEGNSWYTINEAGGTWKNGVMTITGINPDPGMIAALLVVRSDFGLETGIYSIEVELVPTN